MENQTLIQSIESIKETIYSEICIYLKNHGYSKTSKITELSPETLQRIKRKSNVKIDTLLKAYIKIQIGNMLPISEGK